eukprot:TRINITY_DN2252_c0_g1_i1.p1 TRINITY_DN2252_c0_g1~~TRINITY_DN2252_c0_g1_i1.p1  ORF type:complete len:329 (+),score=50.34 TRINITY_DN2252_c0_g1_i1:76-987(+)
MSLTYFVISALDVLDSLDLVDRQATIDWIYSLQLLPQNSSFERCGFRGSAWIGNKFSPSGCQAGCEYDSSHIAMTYTALAILRILGDNYEKVNKKAIVDSLRTLQQPDGSFWPAVEGLEADMRFVFCAAAISHFLDDWSGIDLEKMVQYIRKSQSYDFGLAQGPGGESHGGSTYCALAALSLAGRLDELPHKEELVNWCVERQLTGFQGRINKDPDTCYGWWVGASLSLLNSYELIDFQLNSAFIMGCQKKIGGFSKSPDIYPDVLHSYYSLVSFSMMGMHNLLPVDCRLGITQRASQSQPKN